LAATRGGRRKIPALPLVRAAPCRRKCAGASSSSGRDRPAGRPGPERRRSKNAARQPARSQMETFGIVLSMLAAVVLSGIVVRALPLGIPTPLVQIALGAVIAAASDYEVRLDPQLFFLLFLP